MDQRTQFLLQVLEKIGSPLTMSVVAAPAGDAASDARRVAELLNRSVQLGLSVADMMNLRDESQADGVHLALAAFSGPLIAGQYMTTGRVPAEGDIRRMAGALQAVMTFADGFSPAADTTLRLENTEAGSDHADDVQVQVQMLNAFAPVLQAVAQYTFGRPDHKLVQEVGARIIQYAEDACAEIFGSALPAREKARVTLVLLRLMAGIYAAAHMGEMARLMSLPEADRNRVLGGVGGVSMDPIWATVDRQVEMMHVLARSLLPAEGGGASASKAAPETGQSPDIAAPVPPADPGNPMAFFVRKKAEGE